MILQMEIHGAPYEMGYKVGSACADLICRFYAKACRFEGGDKAEVARTVDKIEDNLRRTVPDTLEEMEGIAAGCGLSYRDILAMNSWVEISTATTGAWCTIVAFANTPAGVIVGKNNDCDQGDDQYHLMQRAFPSRGYRFIHCTFPGTLWTAAGINEVGLAYAGGSIKCQEANWDGIPTQLMIRRFLQYCATIDEAVKMAREIPIINHGINMILAESGRAVLIEKLPVKMTVWQMAGRVIFATNHTAGPRLQGDTHEMRDFLNNSYARYENLSSLTQSIAPTVEGMQGLLRNHGPLGAICQHGDAGLYTAASFVLIPKRREMLLAHGSPCENDYQTFSI
jgi:isopenicillin-N N-acyltransferase-like protein